MHCISSFLFLSFGTPLFSLPRLVFHHLIVLSPFSLLSLHFLFSFFQKSSIFIFKLHEYRFFSCFISKNFNFYLQTPWIQVRFLVLSQKVLIFASILVDVVFMCFVFLLMWYLPLFAFVCVFFLVFCFFSCMFIVSSKDVIFISKNFDFYLQTPWTRVRFLALSQKASIFISKLHEYRFVFLLYLKKFRFLPLSLLM